MRIFISGGCKNGKSGRAQELAARLCPVGKPLYYAATMRPVDAEDEARILRHRREREGMGFITVECPDDILSLADNCDLGGCFLIDSVTALLMNAMFPPGGDVVMDAPNRLCRELGELLPRLSHAVVVSDYIYSDAALYDDLTSMYRKGLALADRTVASVCEVVAEASGGNLIFHKGAELFAKMMKGAAT